MKNRISIFRRYYKPQKAPVMARTIPKSVYYRCIHLFFVCLSITVISAQENIETRNTTTPQSTPPVIVNTTNPAYGYEKFDPRQTPDSNIGRMPHEVIEVDLRLRRPVWKNQNPHKSLPADVPFYIEGKINKNVETVYVVIAEKIRGNKTDEERESIIQSNLETGLKNDKSLLEIKNLIVEDLKKARKMWPDKSPQVVISNWSKPEDFVNFKDDTQKNHQVFSVLIDEISAGAHFNIFFFFELKPTKSKQDKIATKLTTEYLEQLYETNSPFDDMGYTVENINKSNQSIWENSLDEVRQQFNIYGYNPDRVEKEYRDYEDKEENELDKYLEAFFKKIERYNENLTIIEGESMSLRQEFLLIDCELLSLKLEKFLHPKLLSNVFLGEIPIQKGNRGFVKKEDLEVRVQNITALLNYVDSVYNESCILIDCCKDQFIFEYIPKVRVQLLNSLDNSQAALNAQKELAKRVKAEKLKTVDAIVTRIPSVSIPLSSFSSFKSRAEASITPDFGFIYQISKVYPNQVLPYYGVNFNFKPINRQNPYCLYDMLCDIIGEGKVIGNEKLFEPFSLTLGMTFGNDFSDDRREAFLPGLNSSGLIGLGTRVNDYLRITSGLAVYKETDANLLRNQTLYKQDLFFALSIDLDLEELFGNTLGRIF